MSEESLERLSENRTDLRDPFFLHYHSLFAELENASVQAHGALLDIGCGNKPYEKMFREKVSSHTGCDVVQSSKQKVDIICPATAIPVPSESFDTVLCTQVLEHVADHQILLREAFRSLKPGGVLILSCPMYWHLHEAPHDFFRFTQYGLRHLMESTGFAKIEIKPNGGKWAVCGQVILHSLTGGQLFRPRVIRLINTIFSYLDDKYPDFQNTLNYVVVARKP